MNMLSQASCPSYRGLYGTGRDAVDTMPHLVLYDDQDTHSGRCPAECRARYIGYLQVDEDAGYHSTEAKLVGCMAHARRQFEVYRRRQSASLPLMAAFGQWLPKTAVLVMR